MSKSCLIVSPSQPQSTRPSRYANIPVLSCVVATHIRTLTHTHTRTLTHTHTRLDRCVRDTTGMLAYLEGCAHERWGMSHRFDRYVANIPVKTGMLASCVVLYLLQSVLRHSSPDAPPTQVRWTYPLPAAFPSPTTNVYFLLCAPARGQAQSARALEVRCP